MKKDIDLRLFDREQLMDFALSGASIILFVIDLDGVIRLSEGKGLEGLRPLRGESVGRSIYELYADHPEIIGYIHRARRGETLTELVEVLGYVFETRYAPLVGSDGTITGVVGVATNITSQHSVESALHASQERLRSIFQETEVGIVVQDLEGVILESNPAFEHMLGYSKVELLSKAFSDFTFHEDLAGYQKLYDQLKRGERDHFRIEKRYVRKDGMVIWGRLNASLLRDAEGSPHAVTLMVEDYTATRQLQSELTEVQHRLMANLEEQRLRIAQDLHDGPLQELYGMAFSLKEALTLTQDPVMIEKLNSIYADLERGMRDLRSFTSDLRPPTLAPFGLEKAIRSHAQTFQSSHPDIKIHLELQKDGQKLPEDVRLTLFRIYQESLNNVVKHAKATEVTAKFELDAGKAVVEIADNGAGFEVPDRWVEIARQGHFGLLGAQERAEAVGGRLSIQSRPGQGTRVRAEIPIASNDHSKSQVEGV